MGVSDIFCVVCPRSVPLAILVTWASVDPQLPIVFISTASKSKLLFYKVVKPNLGYKHAQTHTSLPSLWTSDNPNCFCLGSGSRGQHAPFEVESTSADLHFANFALFL